MQAAGASGPRDHTYLSLGTFYFYGRSVQPVSGVLADGVTPTVLTAREPFYRIGGDINFNYRNFNVFGVYVAAHDHNLVPVTAPGASGITGFTPGTAATFSGGFVQADYLALPWAMSIMRWDQVKSSADRINFIQYDPTRPAVLFLFLALCVHAQSLHARRAVPDPRQHQGLHRIPDHAPADRL